MGVSAGTTLLVPAGAEERAVRRAAPGARIVVIRAGAASARLAPGRSKRPGTLYLGLCGALRPLPVGTPVVYTAAIDEQGRVEIPELSGYRSRSRLHVGARSLARAAARRTRAAVRRRHRRDGGDARRPRPCGARHCLPDAPHRQRRCRERASADGTRVRARRRRCARSSLAAAFARAPVAAARFINDVRRALRTLTDVVRKLDLPA